eukprot:3391551-Amphidinium_carterae.1
MFWPSRNDSVKVALALALLVGRTFVPQEDVVVADNSTLGAVDAQQQQLVQMVQLPDAAQGSLIADRPCLYESQTS